jgi:hypothetical protein
MQLCVFDFFCIYICSFDDELFVQHMNFASQEYTNPLQEYETNYEDDFQDEVE